MIIIRTLAESIKRLKLSQRTLCTDAVAKVSSSNGAQPSNDHVERPNFSNKCDPYDIAIIGGGMVGMALACSLAKMPLTKHLKVAIIDSNPAVSNGLSIKKEDPPDPRASAVTPATISLFQDIGAWKYVEQNRHAYFDQMQEKEIGRWSQTRLVCFSSIANSIVWDYTGLGYTRYNARDDLMLILSYDRVKLQQNTDFQKTVYPSRLSTMILQPRNLSMGMESTSSGLNEQGNLAKLDLIDGNSPYAKLVVGADGSKSRVREFSGFKTTGWNYSQNAIICTVEHSVENRFAWQRFLPAGPIALLPIDTNLSANDCFKVPPKVLKLASERMVFPLSLMHANDYVPKHVVLIGDAAHTVHPLAGQGVNLGFGDAFALSRIICEGIAVGTDITDVLLLKKYEAERKSANVTMMAILDGFQKAYSVDFGPLNVLRAAAFNGAQYIPSLKRSIISYALRGSKIANFFLRRT
ncbi:hypothetical protein DVH24_019983 [Malus domestica]|uniref:FAD-binding domain-containing protein n=1 Tax=Malus domestica TaxID=3750 RepID=A0A498I4S7_MALDO|nr:hypothetical protein DVH24_019983 [Malus domestica]